MSLVSTVCVLLAVLASVPASAVAAETLARVLGADLDRAELDAAGDDAARVARLRDWVWQRVYGQYIAEHGLSATAGDVSAFLAYHREFERRDRIQRARKLEELNGRLANSDLDADERARLEEFRGILARMAERDSAGDGTPSDVGEQAGLYEPVIEFWKANRALYLKYGGTVAVTRTGPAAHGAHLALIADYERRGLVQFLDADLRRQLFDLMSRPPGIVVPPERVDFTPYWTLPIPPSYFPD